MIFARLNLCFLKNSDNEFSSCWLAISVFFFHFEALENSIFCKDPKLQALTSRLRSARLIWLIQLIFFSRWITEIIKNRPPLDIKLKRFIFVFSSLILRLSSGSSNLKLKSNFINDFNLTAISFV